MISFYNKIAFLIIVSVLIMSCGPMANFTVAEGENIAPVKVYFENTSKKAETYQWDFGDGTISEAESPTHRYTASGNYVVALKAIKGNKTKIKEKRVVVNAPELCLVELETPYGNMVVHLFDATPQHRDNFVKLVEEGFYQELLFHRVINGFMIQGGDPNSKNAAKGQPLGTGGPGYQVPAEFVETLVHTKGALAAARIGGPANPDKKSSGSQFYIVHGQPVPEDRLSMMERQKGIKYDEKAKADYINKGGTPFLDGEYTVFGQVVEGLDVIDKIAEVQTDGRDRPLEDVKMKIKVIK